MNLKSILSSLVLLAVTATAFSQEVEDNTWMSKPFFADGNSSEWNEPLNEYNNDTKLAFALANDGKNLYIIIESLDPVTTKKILFDGINLNINTLGKKKHGVNLTFPFHEPDHNQMAAMDSTNKEQHVKHHFDAQALSDPDKQMIKVAGFKHIQDGLLHPNNEFGVLSGMQVKPNQDLIYELAIPLAQLDINLDNKNAIAYNIKLNATHHFGDKDEKRHDGAGAEGSGRRGGGMGGGQRGGGMGRSGGMGGGRRMSGGGGGGNFSQEKSDFWIKFKLAKA